MNMKNLKKSGKSRGIVAFAYNTDTTNYVSIAQKTLSVASKYLDLPCQLITDELNQTVYNTRYDVDLDKFVEWKNFDRYSAFDLSPFDETIVIDADCLLIDRNFLKIFDCDWDYILQRNSHALTTEWYSSMGNNSLPYIWATVFAFRKTERSKMFFQLVKRIQTHYGYYRALFNIQERNFRNDYAFAIADIVLNGFTINHDTIPGSLLAINQPIDSIRLNDTNFIVKDNVNAYVVPKTNLHIMSKAYLQSQDFELLTQHLLNDTV